MADIAFGGVEKVIKLALKIQEQVKTVRRNKHECQDLEQDVSTIIEILSPMRHNSEVMSQPGINLALLGLERCLNRALDLVKDCQESSTVRRFFTAGDMSSQLRQVQNDILRKMTMVILAANMLQVTTITWTRTIHSRGGALTQPQDAGAAEFSYNSHLITDDARSGVNNEITMLQTGKEVPYAPSSRLTTFSLSESEATIQHFSEENISGASGHSFIMQQKIVIKISMPSDSKTLSKAMKLIAGAAGLRSVTVTGDGRDQLELVGAGVDSVGLVFCLRKKLGYAEILKVEQVKDKKPVEPSEEEQERMGDGDGTPGGVASAAAGQHGRSYSSSEGPGQITEDLPKNKPDEPEIGARERKKGWAMKCRMVWRQLAGRQGNKAGATTAVKGQGTGMVWLYTLQLTFIRASSTISSTPLVVWVVVAIALTLLLRAINFMCCGFMSWTL